MTDTAESAPQKVGPKKLWKELNYFEIGLIVLVIGYFVYLNNATALVLNYNGENETRIINGVENKPGQVIYGTNSYVPKSNISNTQTFFGAALVLLLIYIILSKIIKSSRRATIYDAIDDIAKQLIKVRQIEKARTTAIRNGMRIISDFEEIDLTYQFLTRYKSKGDVREAFRYTIHVDITDKNTHAKEYYRAYYHPWSRYWDGLVKAEQELSADDQCSKCGKEYDEKIIIADDLKKIKYIRETIPGRT